MSVYYERTVEDVTQILACAKQKDSEVNPLTQIFYYPVESESKEAKDNLRLLAIDEKLIQKLEDGERFAFKGGSEEKVVLCTDNETYEVKEGEISNSLLLCPNLLFNSDVKQFENAERFLQKQEVCGVLHNYLELRLTFPKLSKLKEILKETEYSGPNNEGKDQGYYFHELLDMIQCSRNELIESLKDFKAISLNGKWRALSLTYLTDVFSHIINLMERQKWKEINAAEAKILLEPLVPEFIFEHILEHYTTPTSESNDLYRFKEDLVSRCYAEVLLITAEGKFRYDEFMMAWTQCLHPVINADLNDLKGLVLVEKDEGYQKSIVLFPEKSLPENVAERFRLLFKKKEKWTLDEITPYIRKLATKNMNVDTMLTKYTRSSKINGTKIFSAKYPK